ncbi:MAG: hypothetical protein WKG07_35485 [Hymenobacter sp.]
MVVTPETPANVDKTIAKTKATFPIVTDQNFAIMKALQNGLHRGRGHGPEIPGLRRGPEGG